jgi:hypothetical protein
MSVLKRDVVVKGGCALSTSYTSAPDYLPFAATVPASDLPPLMPRIIAQRTAEAVLTRRIKLEVQAMTQALVVGYTAWDTPGQ